MVTFSKDTLVRRNGFEGEGGERLARELALRHGLRVAGLSGAIWPSANPMWIKMVADELIEEFVTFSVHVRRFLELKKLHGLKAAGSLWTVQDWAVAREEDVWTIVNKVLHSRKIEVVTADAVPERFENLGDTVVLHMHVKSDKGEECAFCPSSVVYAVGSVE